LWKSKVGDDTQVDCTYTILSYLINLSNSGFAIAGYGMWRLVWMVILSSAEAMMGLTPLDAIPGFCYHRDTE